MPAERIGGLFWLAVGLGSIFGSIQLGVGTFRNPGSGFLSLLAGFFICLMALIILFQSFLLKPVGRMKVSTLWQGTRWGRPLTIGILLVVFILFLETTGFLLTSLFTLLIMFRGIEKLSWRRSLILAIAISAISFILFNHVLKASLPRGIFGF
jgi:putative tricarboxylic transport membrane protein